MKDNIGQDIAKSVRLYFKHFMSKWLNSSRFQYYENPYKKCLCRMYPLSKIAINYFKTRLDKIIIDVNELSDFLIWCVNLSVNVHHFIR